MIIINKKEVLKIKIPFKIVTLNDYIYSERSNKFKAHSIKKKLTEAIYWVAKSYKWECEKDKQYFIKYVWGYDSKRQDSDNIEFGKKFILDGLVNAGIFDKDNLNRISGSLNLFEKKEGVDVYIYEHYK